VRRMLCNEGGYNAHLANPLSVAYDAHLANRSLYNTFLHNMTCYVALHAATTPCLQ